jgi:hypothetical protein
LRFFYNCKTLNLSFGVSCVCILFADLEKWSRFHLLHFQQKIWLINSIWVLKANYAKPVSTAVLAPRQKTSSFNIDSYEIFIRISLQANWIFSFHNPALNTNGLSFLKNSVFHLPLQRKSPTTFFVGWKTLTNVSFSFEPFNLFCFPLF